MEITREYILRLQKNRQGTVVGGSGTVGGNYVTPAQLESALANKVDVSFFSRLFELYNGEGTTAAKIETNATLPEDTSKLNIKAPFDFWSQRSVSALGKGSGGGSDASGFDEAAMWTALGGSIDNQQISRSHLTTALSGYVKGVKVGSTTYSPNGSGIVDLGTIEGRTYAFATGTTNGTFKVTPSVGDAYEVAIKGLGTLAYKASLTAADIPNLDAAKITTGILGVDRIPGLAASKIVSGTLDVDRIPGLSADKITSGTLSVDRIPDLSGKYVTTTFFNKLFRAQDASGNDITVNASTAVDSIKAMVGFWTEQYISALDKGDDGTAAVFDEVAMWNALKAAGTANKIHNDHLNLYSLSIKTKNGTISYNPATGAQTIDIPTLTGDYLKLDGSNSMTGNVTFGSTGHGVCLKDSAGNSYGGAYDNGTNLWIGATEGAGYHHKGQTFISAGWSGTKGNDTIYISVPTTDNTGGGNQHSVYGVWHAGNFNPANYVRVDFFDQLFQLYNDSVKISVNGSIPADKSKLNIKAMFGFWTEKYISALGKGDSGSESVFDEAAMWNALKTAGAAHKIDNSHLNLGTLTISNGTTTLGTWTPTANGTITISAGAGDRLAQYALADGASVGSFTHTSDLIYTAKGGGNGCTDKPDGVDAFGVLSFKTAIGYYGQVLMPAGIGRLYVRSSNSLDGTAWNEVALASDLSAYTKTTSMKSLTIKGGTTNAVVYNPTDANAKTVTIKAGTGMTVTGAANEITITRNNLSASDIPNLDWSKITTGKPNALAGYGISASDAIFADITAGKASKLASKVKLWGNDFDGSNGIGFDDDHKASLNYVNDITMGGAIRMPRSSNGIQFGIDGDYTTGMRTFINSKVLSVGYETTKNKEFNTNIYGADIMFLTRTVTENALEVKEPSFRMVVKGNGYVGIGTTQPVVSLDVNGHTRTNRLYLYKPNADNDTNAVYLVYDSNGGVHLVGAGFYADTFVSALGKNDDGTAAVFDESAMWQALGTNSTTKKISNSYLNLGVLTIKDGETQRTLGTWTPTADGIISISTNTGNKLEQYELGDMASLGSFTHDTALIYAAKGGGNNVTDKPANVDSFGIISFKTATAYYGQILLSDNLYFRRSNTLDGGWRKVLDSENWNTVIDLSGYLTQHQTVTLSSGTNNGTLKLTVGGTPVDNIAVKGLKGLAFKDSLSWTELTGKPTTLADYGITDAVSSATKWWGQSVQTVNNAKVVKGDMTDVGSITMSGHVRMNRGQFVQMFINNDYRNVLGIDQSDAILSLGFRTAEQGIDTRIFGTSVKLWYFDTTWREGLTLANNGNVGIGTTDPSYRMDVSGDAHVSGDLRVGNERFGWNAVDGRDVFFGYSWNGDEGIYRDMVLGTYIDAIQYGGLYFNGSSWSWGIGFSEPKTKLDVNGGIKASRFYLYKPNADNDTNAVYLVYDSNGGVHLVGAGFYADTYVSALGMGDDGGASTFDESQMWTALGGSISNKQVAFSHLSTALAPYATQTWVQEQLTGVGDFRNMKITADGDYGNYSKYGYSYAACNFDSLANVTGIGQYDTLISMGTGLRTAHFLASHYGNGLKYRVLENKGGGVYGFCDWRTIWHSGNDGSGSGLDADLLDGKHASEFALASNLSNYLPLSGGTVTSPAHQPLILRTTSDADYNWVGLSFRKYIGGTETAFGGIRMDSQDSYLKRYDSTFNVYTILDSGNSSVSLSGETLTVKINGISKSLTNTNTWRGIQDSLTSDSATDSLSAKQGKALKGLIDGNTTNIGTLQGYFSNGVANSASKLSTVSKTLWGNTYWTAGGVPTDVGTASYPASLSNVVNITMSGNINMQQGHYITAYIDDAYYNVLGAWGGTLKLIQLGYNTSLSKQYATNIYGHTLRLYGSSSNLGILINTSGNVGIGTPSPAQKLDVDGNIHASGHIYLDNYKHIEIKNTSDTYLNVLTFTNANQFVLGEGLQGYPTYLRGNTLTLQTGISNAAALSINANGRVIVENCESTSLQITDGGLKIGDALLSWDSTNNALMVSTENGGAVNFYATGGVSSLGMSDISSGRVVTDGDGTFKMYTALANTESIYGTETVCMQTAIDGNDPETYGGTSGIPSNVASRCVLALQPRGGRVGIGITNPSYTLHVNGSAYARTLTVNGMEISWDTSLGRYYFNTDNQDVETEGTWRGTFVSGSDIRLKDINQYLDGKLEDIARAPIFSFKWKDRKNKQLQLGTSAQYWQDILPFGVFADARGTLALDYGATALAAAVFTARKVVDHELRVKQLEERIAELENEIKELKAA